ncbi:unnamed protein product [Brassica napus]|uniref:(rape) hypothetical protein n=1 Tax=Brassica napus TaxID=3708 RepID=A0A816KVL8_BRANA|nr:unnamed protein product [Brassica napus]
MKSSQIALACIVMLSLFALHQCAYIFLQVRAWMFKRWRNRTMESMYQRVIMAHAMLWYLIVGVVNICITVGQEIPAKVIATNNVNYKHN